MRTRAHVGVVSTNRYVQYSVIHALRLVDSLSGRGQRRLDEPIGVQPTARRPIGNELVLEAFEANHCVRKHVKIYEIIDEGARKATSRKPTDFTEQHYEPIRKPGRS